VPHARFLLHGVGAQFTANARLEEKQLEERLKSVRIDAENIARIIASTAGTTTEEVVNAMRERTTLNAEQAQEWGLVTEIDSHLFPAGAEVVSISEQAGAGQPS
jgi:ATP-dependent protease ClpP protease subunit